MAALSDLFNQINGGITAAAGAATNFVNAQSQLAALRNKNAAAVASATPAAVYVPQTSSTPAPVPKNNAVLWIGGGVALLVGILLLRRRG